MASSANGEKLVFVQKIQIEKPTTMPTPGDFTTGIFAVSVVPTTAPNAAEDGAVLLLQVAVRNDGLYSSRHSASQICSELKLDRSNSILSHAAAADGMKSSTSRFSPEVDHLVRLLESTVEPDRTTTARQIAFELLTVGRDDALRITIKERMKTEMVRLLWSTQLASDKSGSLLDLTLRLLQQQEDVSAQLASVKTQYSRLEKDRNGWKDTATALEGKWEEEKSILFQNFCDLYTAKQQHEQSKVEGLQKEIEKLKEDVAEAEKTWSRAGSTRHYELPECLQNLPDDIDREGGYDAEMVRLLAEGKRLLPPEQRKRRNPTTGAMEYFDATAALEDVLQSAASVAAPPAKQARVAVNKKEERERAAAAPRREPKAKPPQTPPTKEKEPAPPASDSETGSDDDFEKAFEAKMLADLAAQRKSQGL